ncbi:MAG: hypothetical protein KDJ14_01880 [Xanthomonadales bacterium]|nr:hypothetical protein [Xanthomonadales bacterium]
MTAWTKRWLGAALAAGMAGTGLSALASDAAVTAEVMPLVTTRSVMLDITEAASRGVMVGERGHVFVSESRTDWRQVEGVPTRVTLTAVDAVGDTVWAVGHDGTIIKSTDGGLSWALKRQDAGSRAGEPIADEAADASMEWDPQAGAPLLDVAFFDEQNGFAIGAFSLMLHSVDGGETWEKVDVNPQAEVDEPADDEPAAEGDGWTFDESDLELQEEDDPHLNAIVRTPSGLMMVVGERGSAYRSRDRGATWERLQLPYAGSMFGVIALGSEHLVAFGLRGHVLETQDGGTSWNELDTGTELSLMGGAALDQGGFVIVGANGIVLRRENAGAAIEVGTFVNGNQETPILASVLPRGSQTFIVCGEKGVGEYRMTP